MINDTHNSQSVQKNWYVFGKKPKKKQRQYKPEHFAYIA